MVKGTAAHLGAEGRALLLGALIAFAGGSPAQALVIDPGDMVGVWVKNGFEVVVNLGPATPGAPMDLAGTIDSAEFGGSLVGARFIGLAVEDPDRTVNVPRLRPAAPREHHLHLADRRPDADGHRDRDRDEAGGQHGFATAAVWFQVLRQLPGTDSELIASTELFSYELVLGAGGTDAIDNTLHLLDGGRLRRPGAAPDLASSARCGATPTSAGPTPSTPRS